LANIAITLVDRALSDIALTTVTWIVLAVRHKLLNVYSPSNFISGGYFLVKQIARPKDVTEILPTTLLTLSNCFTDIAPDDWANVGYNYNDGERVAEAAKFGISANSVPRLIRLLGEGIGSQHSNAFLSLPLAEVSYRECVDKREIALLGIGLDPMLVSSLQAQRNDDVNSGYGLLERVELRVPLASSGEVLGFEPLGFEATKFHSWLCHNAPVDTFKKFGIGTNSNGFITKFDDALRVTRHLKSTGAEPGIWEPWLVVKYRVR
jgi:hypothetical protein